MLTFSLDEDAETIARSKYGFEIEFNIEESQVVRFPLDMGMNGLAYKHDAVLWINTDSTAKGSSSKMPSPSVYQVKDIAVP